MKTNLPPPRVPLAGSLEINREWYLYLLGQFDRLGGSSSELTLPEIEQSIDDLETTTTTQSGQIADIQSDISDINSDIGDLQTDKEDVANKVTSLSALSTDVQYPSAKLVYDQLAGKQASGSYADSVHVHAPSDITGTAVITTDSRLSDARTPTAHNQAETTITFSDVTTGNATTGQHGFLPKLGGGTSNFLRADGTWAAPAGGSGLTYSQTLSAVSLRV